MGDDFEFLHDLLRRTTLTGNNVPGRQRGTTIKQTTTTQQTVWDWAPIDKGEPSELEFVGMGVEP